MDKAFKELLQELYYAIVAIPDEPATAYENAKKAYISFLTRQSVYERAKREFINKLEEIFPVQVRGNYSDIIDNALSPEIYRNLRNPFEGVLASEESYNASVKLYKERIEDYKEMKQKFINEIAKRFPSNDFFYLSDRLDSICEQYQFQFNDRQWIEFRREIASLFEITDIENG